MNLIDWGVLSLVLILIVAYGTWKSGKSKNIDDYLLGNKSLPWWTVCLSIMATQASAITFLSTPGQAYEDGMRFLQFYFGLPLAMVILSITAIKLYHRLNVYTAYEYLETRFDVKVRSLAAFLFLILRGLSVGITIYAPSLILSTILKWDINITSLFIGSLVAVYTVSGGAKAVSMTQKYQMLVMMGGMIIAGCIAFYKLPEEITFLETFHLAGEMGKLNLVNLSFDLKDRYNIWSGLIGGLFLFMSYFGTDQSQVGRYLGGKSIRESRLGLIFNGLLKVPMQFIILYIGVLIFVFYQFYQAPIFHNSALKEEAMSTSYSATINDLESEYDKTFVHKKEIVEGIVKSIKEKNAPATDMLRKSFFDAQSKEKHIRSKVKETLSKAIPGANTMDKDYVFIHFVMTYLPHGLIGLLLAVVFSAAMSSTSSELNALTSTSLVDIYKRSIRPKENEYHYVKVSQWFTIGWAVLGIGFAMMANQSENLIQFVNIIGSLFYGTILGIFLSAFYLKYIKSEAVFIAAIIAQLIILYCYFYTDIAFLLYNIIGCIALIVMGFFIQFVVNRRKRSRLPKKNL